jgi:putative exosortase-associated protein (TIGR04073 family)
MRTARCSFPRLGIGLCATALVGVGIGAGADTGADTATEKAGRGLAAMTTGFLEVPGQMVAETRLHGAAYGVPFGFVEGLGGIVVRELVGVYEFVTAPIPAPADYRPILQPEYPWGYFDETRVAERDAECSSPVAGADGGPTS